MNIKKNVGYKAAEYVKSGMTVGLGTGTTAYYLVEALGKRVAEEGLEITGVTTSSRTSEQALSLNIPVKDLNEVDAIDVTIDGADEISSDYQGIKGGGAAHLYEKIVAVNSNKNIWVVEERKMVEDLGAFPLPVEVIKTGSAQLYRLFENEKMKPSWRLEDNGEKLLSDDENYIIDLNLTKIDNPHDLSNWLNSLVGVVEHGLFLDIVNTIIVGSEDDGVQVLDIR